MQNISPIKQRILQYIDTLGISKREFYAQTGISRGTLESQTGITEETVAKFIVFYPQINATWLLTGSGSQFLSDKSDGVVLKPENKSHPGICEMCKMKDKLIESQAQQIEILSKLIHHLENKKCPEEGQKRKAAS